MSQNVEGELLRFANNARFVFVARDLAGNIGRGCRLQQWIVDIALSHICGARLIRSLLRLATASGDRSGRGHESSSSKLLLLSTLASKALKIQKTKGFYGTTVNCARHLTGRCWAINCAVPIRERPEGLGRPVRRSGPDWRCSSGDGSRDCA